MGGVRQLGMPRQYAGATVEMGWNEAMMAQAQGWGEMQTGSRPHHARPHLKEGGRAPELDPSDGLSPQQRASLRVKGGARVGASGKIGGNNSTRTNTTTSKVQADNSSAKS